MYDLAIYTGPTPINTPWMGLKELLKPHELIGDRVQAQKNDGLV